MKVATLALLGLFISVGWSFSENIVPPPGYETYPNEQLANLSQDVNFVNVGEKNVLSVGSKCYADGIVLLISDNYVLLKSEWGGYLIRAHFSKNPDFRIGEEAIVWGTSTGYPKIPSDFRFEYQGGEYHYYPGYFADMDAQYYYCTSLGANYNMAAQTPKGDDRTPAEASSSENSQSRPDISIKDNAGNLSKIPNSYSKDIISNMTDAMAYFGVEWTPLDYQAAVYKEYGRSDRFVLEGTVQQIVKNSDGSFTYFAFLSNWNSLIHGNLEDEAAIVTPNRVKGLDVGNNGVFYCQYTDTRKFEAISKLTNSKSIVELPTFKASSYGIGLQ